MEGTFRILQESDNRFVIQKQYEKVQRKGLFFKEKKTVWVIVNKKGNRLDILCLNDWENSWYLTLYEAQQALNNILKYPIVVYQTK